MAAGSRADGQSGRHPDAAPLLLYLCHMSRTPDPRTRGATIADIIVAIGISLVSLGMAVPNLRAFAAPYSLDTATRVVAAEFSVARMRAIAQNRRHRINFDDGADTFALQAETAPGVFTDVGATRPMPACTTANGHTKNLPKCTTLASWVMTAL